MFGEVFTAPLLTIDEENIRGSMEKEVADKEYQLKQKKKTVGKAKAKPAAAPSGPSNEEATIHVDDDVWSVPSDDEGQKSDKPAKASKSNTDKDAATAARKALREARELASSWRKEVNKAAKNMAALNNVCQSLNGTITRCNKSDGLFPDDQLESLGNALGKCTKFRQRSWARRTRNSCLRPNDLIIERCDRCQIRIVNTCVSNYTFIQDNVLLDYLCNLYL